MSMTTSENRLYRRLQIFPRIVVPFVDTKFQGVWIFQISAESLANPNESSRGFPGLMLCIIEGIR